MTTYEEYYDAQLALEEKYGEKSIVLMQVGSFYEIYGVDTSTCKIGHAEHISKILSMLVAYKHGRDKPHTRKNPQMVGFPDHALGNHLEKLLKANYTVSIYNQFDTGDKKKTRKQVNVYSPSTFIDEDIGESNALMVIGTGDYKCMINKTMIEYAHVSILDLVTGEVLLTSVYNTAEDNKKVETEMYRMIHTYNPSEILYSGKQDELEKRYDITNKKVYRRELNKTYKEPAYQNEFLKKIYKLDDTLRTSIELLGLQYQSDVIPYFIQGLQYVYEHDPLILQNIRIPRLVDTDKRLTLNNDSIYQLHLVSSSTNDYGDVKFTSVFNTVNQTRTAMGKRLLKNRLLMPTTSKKVLNARYTMIENVMPVYKKYDDLLKGICDIDRKYRKMAAKRLHPYELAAMRDSFLSIILVLEEGIEMFEIDEELLADFKSFYEEYEETFDRKSMKSSKIGMAKSSYFNEGVCDVVDEIENIITSQRELLEEIAKGISDNIDENKSCVSIMHNTTDGYYMKTTAIRYKNMSKDDIELESGKIKYEDLDIVKLKSVVKITCSKTKKISKKLTGAQFKLSSVITAEYLKILETWSEQWGEMFGKISAVLGNIDFIVNAAKIAKMYGYVKPIISLDTKKSFITAKKLRHPIIERIVTKTKYVSNDVEIGVDNCGMILYGVNMSGKSSLLRSVGTAIVMAQAGLYVSAEYFEYYPFTSIISKITVQDNPFKGQSLFMVEMDEVNNMLRRGDERTLVLSDELCSSTETSSAHAIVACTLKKLADKNVNFIFSTHLHELQKIPAIKNNDQIKIMHFQVSIKNSEMVFDRQLQEGGIPDTYGLEIARALGLPKEFIKEAFDIRDHLKENNDEILSTKKSKYCKDLYMHKCSYCGTTKALETHHIYFQCTANSEGLILTETDCIQKNQKFNLIVVCRDCHMKIHKNEIELGIKKLKISV
jgi:DNA mismatch repair protein MutS